MGYVIGGADSDARIPKCQVAAATLMWLFVICMGMGGVHKKVIRLGISGTGTISSTFPAWS